jgi:hypothetical protein
MKRDYIRVGSNYMQDQEGRHFVAGVPIRLLAFFIRTRKTPRQKEFGDLNLRMLATAAVHAIAQRRLITVVHVVAQRKLVVAAHAVAQRGLIAVATSYEHLKTVDGVLLPSFREAAKRRGRIKENNTLDECLPEATFFQMSSSL